MKKINFLTQAAMIAALYVVLTLAINAFGLASGAIQVRVSEALTILPYFTPAAIPGLFIGCLLSNTITGCALFDIIFGSIATLLGAVGTYLLRRHKWLAPVSPIIANTIIVPFVLSYVYGTPGTIPYLMLTVGIGEVLSCGVLGMDHSLAVTLNAIVLAMIPTLAIVLISKQSRMTPTTMILAGVAIMYVFRSMTSLMTLMADSENVEQLYIWNVGSLGPASWDNVGIVLAVTVICIVVLQLMSRDIGLMTVGDRSASSMGVSVRRVRALSLLLVAVMTATIVGFTGTIGFMGLVAPHVARLLVGSNARYLIPCSAAIGAIILIGCDCIANVIVGIPVGVLTAIIGGPIFIMLLIKGAKRVWF